MLDPSHDNDYTTKTISKPGVTATVLEAALAQSNEGGRKAFKYIIGALAVWLVLSVLFASKRDSVAPVSAPGVTVESAEKTSSLERQYPGVWRGDFNLEIGKTLVKNGVRGCGELYYRAAASSANEYLVYCTSDGSTWTSYLAWTAAQKVMGPYPPDKNLPLPR